MPRDSRQCLRLPSTVQPHSEHEIPVQGLQGESLCKEGEGIIHFFYVSTFAFET